MHVGIDARLVQPARPADCKYHVLGPDCLESAVLLDHDGPGGSFVRCVTDAEKLYDVSVLSYRNIQTLDPAYERPAHLPRRVRADGRRPLPGIVVGLVADELAVGIPGKGYAQVDQANEGPGRKAGFDQGEVAVHAPAGEVRFGHHGGCIGVVAAHRELVVGLLVAAGVDRGAHLKALGDDQHVFDAPLLQLHGGVQARGPAADHQGVDPRQGQGDRLTGVVRNA